MMIIWSSNTQKKGEGSKGEEELRNVDFHFHLSAYEEIIIILHENKLIIVQHT